MRSDALRVISSLISAPYTESVSKFVTRAVKSEPLRANQPQSAQFHAENMADAAAFLFTVEF